MDLEPRSPVFRQTYENYLAQLRELDFPAVAARMGLEMEGGALVVPVFGLAHLVGKDGIAGPGGGEVDFSVRVLLCRYVIMHGNESPRGAEELVSYRDFKDAAPFVGGFRTNAEAPIAGRFAGRLAQLRAAAEKLGGTEPGVGPDYDLSMEFELLPGVPLVLLFNDEDDEFPAAALILFERRAAMRLDMECLALAGWLLADRLIECDGGPRSTIA